MVVLAVVVLVAAAAAARGRVPFLCILVSPVVLGRRGAGSMFAE